MYIHFTCAGVETLSVVHKCNLMFAVCNVYVTGSEKRALYIIMRYARKYLKIARMSECNFIAPLGRHSPWESSYQVSDWARSYFQPFAGSRIRKKNYGVGMRFRVYVLINYSLLVPLPELHQCLSFFLRAQSRTPDLPHEIKDNDNDN